jgi:carbon-monoxide dehydrogenase small subunit
LQEAFIEYGGFQCGFCTPGMILAAKALLDEESNPTEGIKTFYARQYLPVHRLQEDY